MHGLWQGRDTRTPAQGFKGLPGVGPRERVGIVNHFFFFFLSVIASKARRQLLYGHGHWQMECAKHVGREGVARGREGGINLLQGEGRSSVSRA